MIVSEILRYVSHTKVTDRRIQALYEARSLRWER